MKKSKKHLQREPDVSNKNASSVFWETVFHIHCVKNRIESKNLQVYDQSAFLMAKRGKKPGFTIISNTC